MEKKKSMVGYTLCKEAGVDIFILGMQNKK